MIVPSLFEERGVCGFFTTRQSPGGGEAVAELLGDDSSSLYMPLQRHTDIALSVRNGSEPAVADAVVTDSRAICVGVQVADCVPVLIYDSRNHVAAAVHAGWRGTAQEILTKTIRHMTDRHGSRPADMVIAIGPAIGVCCYEVGQEVVDALGGRSAIGHLISVRQGKYYVDLPGINRLQSLAAGAGQENIWMSGECTCCNAARFHSYRRNGRLAGRQGGFIVPRPPLF